MLQVTPKISATEAAALDAGTIGFDRDIFDGTASVQGLKDKYKLPRLSDREQAFIDNEARMAALEQTNPRCRAAVLLKKMFMWQTIIS